MPAYSTHYIFAKEMMPFLKEISDSKINEDAVYLGTQGPDIFFFHRVMPWMIGKSLRKIGSLLHRSKPEKLFEAMREYCAKSEYPDIAKSYVYGFILHYALDRRCHPYVYSLQDKMVSNSHFLNPHTAHNTVEFSMDLYLLNKRLNIENPVSFDTSKTLRASDAVKAEIGRLMAYTVPKTINKNPSQKQIETALDDTKKIQKLTLDPIGIKRLIITPIETIIAPFSKNFKFTSMMRPRDLEKAKKYGNISNENWKSPFDDSLHNESFEELFDLAKNDAQKMIDAFKGGVSCGDFTKNISFLTGVEVTE
ncbi:MAG: zinc dependent phospholipase C family protein [Clostridiales bacterium]|nr:zinc dependent phospholipase C family protein [Clostridiales bacterium]